MSARDKERYYWLKLDRGFFDQDKIKILETMPNGKDYELFYLKLMVRSIEREGYLRFSDKIPYSDSMLSSITNTDVDKVRSAVKVLRELGMIEILSNQTIYLEEVARLLGSETYKAQRMRAYREEISASFDSEQLTAGSNEPVCSPDEPVCSQDLEKDKDKELETDSEIETELETNSSLGRHSDIISVIDAWNELGLSKISKIITGSKRDQLLKRRLKDYGIDAVLAGIERIKQSSFLQGKGKKGWVITFDWFICPQNFQKVYEGNYDDAAANKDIYHTSCFDPDAIDQIRI